MVTRAALLREVPTFSQLWLREVLPREPLPLPPRKPWFPRPRAVETPSGAESSPLLWQSRWKWLPPHV